MASDIHPNRGSAADHNFEGAWGEHYVGILALSAQLEVAPRTPDRYGIDLHVTGVETVPFERDISADFQVKTFTRDHGEGNYLVYDGLTVKGYNQLVRQSATPKYLIVVTIPAKSSPLTEMHYPHGLMLRHCAYYKLMSSKPPMHGKPPASRVCVEIPRKQVLNEDVFRRLLDVDLTSGASGLESP